MVEDDVRDLIKRYDKIYSDDSTWRALYQDLADYILPRKSDVISIKTPGSKKTQKLFDSTAPHANEQLAASISSSITPKSTQWFWLKTRESRLNQNKEVALWLEDCAKKILLAINQSNFNAIKQEANLEKGCFGQSAIFCEENSFSVKRFTGINFKAFTVGEYLIRENFNEVVNTFFRKFELSAIEAYRLWGEKAGDKVKKCYEKEPDRLTPYLWCVLPQEDWRGKRKPKKFASVYINYEEKILVHEGGFYEFPLFVPRWGKSPNSPNGSGPGEIALPDIKTLNKMIELDLRSRAKNIDPNMFVRDQGVIGSIKTSPSGITYVRGNPSESILIPTNNTRFDVTDIKVNDLRTSIRRIFYSDQLQLQDTPQMTAAEVYVRYELMQRIMGPAFGRIESEELNPMIERIFGIMFRAGAFLPMPDILKRYAGNDVIDIEYEGPLARAQRLGDLNAIQKFYSFVVPISQMRPDVLDIIDIDAALMEVAEITGVPSKVIRSPEEVMKLRKERMAKEEEMQRKEDLKAIAEGAGKVAPAIKVLSELEAERGGGKA